MKIIAILLSVISISLLSGCTYDIDYDEVTTINCKLDEVHEHVNRIVNDIKSRGKVLVKLNNYKMVGDVADNSLDQVQLKFYSVDTNRVYIIGRINL